MLNSLVLLSFYRFMLLQGYGTQYFCLLDESFISADHREPLIVHEVLEISILLGFKGKVHPS